MIGARDAGNVFFGKLPCSAVDQVADVAGVNKEDFIGAVAA